MLIVWSSITRLQGTGTKRFIVGEGRNEVVLLPECLDDFVGPDNPVHIVEAFVDQFELGGLGFKGVDPGV